MEITGLEPVSIKPCFKPVLFALSFHCNRKPNIHTVIRLSSSVCDVASANSAISPFLKNNLSCQEVVLIVHQRLLNTFIAYLCHYYEILNTTSACGFNFVFISRSEFSYYCSASSDCFIFNILKNFYHKGGIATNPKIKLHLFAVASCLSSQANLMKTQYLIM